MEDTVLDKASSDAHNPTQAGTPAAHDGQHAIHIDWNRIGETYVRCFFLFGVVLLVGLLAWRPGLLRLTSLLSFASRMPEGSLDWRPEPARQPPLREQIRLRPPAEWRQGSVRLSTAATLRPGAKDISRLKGPAAAPAWARFSFNPWNWENDSPRRPSRDRDSLPPPPQKPATSYRVGDLAAWPASIAAPAVIETAPHLPPFLAPASPAAAPAPRAADALSLPALPALPSAPRSVASPRARDDAESLRLPELPSLAPLPEKTEKTEQTPDVQPSPMEKPAAPSAVETPTPAAPAKAAAPEKIDWANREIAEAIPGAYLTIYPKLKFVGLCVPGQGYVRKYNQVGVPEELAGPKESAQDGRTPYGRYYVAARSDAGTPGLTLSWPSPEDASRIGLDPARQAEVEAAWRGQTLPPQDTAAGGGLTLTGEANPRETTRGGFALTEAQMLEILTALPPKAWVFVQE